MKMPKKCQKNAKKITLKPQSYIPKEAEILKLVKDYLTIKGWFWFRIQQGIGAYKGISDLIAIKGGRVLFIEVKGQSKKAKQSNDQIEFEKKIVSHGGEYVLVKYLDDLVKRGV